MFNEDIMRELYNDFEHHSGRIKFSDYDVHKIYIWCDKRYQRHIDWEYYYENNDSDYVRFYFNDKNLFAEFTLVLI